MSEILDPVATELDQRQLAEQLLARASFGEEFGRRGSRWFSRLRLVARGGGPGPCVAHERRRVSAATGRFRRDLAGISIHFYVANRLGKDSWEDNRGKQ